MKVKITETAFRDAHQSLLATRMRTRDMEPIIEEMDKVGYHAIEAWGGATFDTCIRYLNEDPWERLRILKENFTETPLQMLLRGQNLLGYKHYADDIVTKFVEKSYENGIDIFRIFDAMNDIRNMEQSIKVAKAQGAHVQGTISYTISPVHTVDKFVEFAKELEALECDSIAIKDMAGLISPAVVFELVSRLKEETDLLVNLHSHCTSGMTPISYYAACQAGVDILDTAISPIAWGTSQPPTESIVASLQGTEYDTELDLKILNQIKKYFETLREKYEGYIDPISERIDTDVLMYQIPGGMLSNLISQLKQQNALDRYQDVLEEMPRVREDMGYPPLVTPTSQIVGIQAVMNVINGERYKIVSNEVKDYMKGYYGRSPAPINQEIAKKIIGDEEPITCRPADLIEPEYENFKKEGEELGIINKEEDVLTLAMLPPVAKQFLKGELEEEEFPEAKKIADVGDNDLGAIPTEYSVEVDGDVFDVKIIPTGYLQIEEKKGGNVGPVQGALTASMQGMVLEDGIVEQIFVEEGDTVNAGDSLMLIKPLDE